MIESLGTFPIASVERNTVVILNIFAVTVSSPQSIVDWSVIAHIILAHYSLYMYSCFCGMIEGHIGEQMMCNVSVGNVVEKIVEKGTP
jgi:hypothetical protein